MSDSGGPIEPRESSIPGVPEGGLLQQRLAGSGSGNPTIGVKAGGGDDALHILRSKLAKYTLCGMEASTRNTVLLKNDLTVPVNDACWTCGREGKRLLGERSYG